MVDRIVNMRGRGLRGMSFADVARYAGTFGTMPTDSDADVTRKFADYAIQENPNFKGNKGDPGGGYLEDIGTFQEIVSLRFPPGIKRIATTGWATIGKGMASLVEVADAGQGTTSFRTRDADGRLWELYTGDTPVNAAEFGGIFDGASHPLSSRFATLEAARAVYPHAFALTDEIDWAAIQAAMDYAREKGRSVGWSGHAIANRPLVICGYPQKKVNGVVSYDDSYGYAKRAKQIGDLIGLGGGGSDGSTTGKRAEITFTNAGAVTDNWPVTAKSIFDPAFPLKVGFISTRASDTSETGGWTLAHVRGIKINGPVNGIGILDANGSNKTVREVYFAGDQRYGFVSCNNRSTRWKDCTFQTCKRAGLGLLYLSDKIIEVSNTGGFFNDGLQIASCAFSSGRRFADIEDHGSQSEGIRLISGCSHTNGATFGYIGRKGVSPMLLSNWYEGIYYPQWLMGSDNFTLPKTDDFSGILPEGNSGIPTTQFFGGWAYGFSSSGNYFGNSGLWPTQACIRADNRGTAEIGPNVSQATRCYIERVSETAGTINDAGLSPTSVAPEVYYRGARQYYHRAGDIGEPLGQPQGVTLPVAVGRGTYASSLTGGAVVNPIRPAGISKRHSALLTQTAGGTSLRFAGWHSGSWMLKVAWSASDGYPLAIAEILLTVESSHSVGGATERDRIWSEVQQFKMLSSPGSRGTAWAELPEISVWPRSGAQARAEAGDTTPPPPHIDLTFFGLASGGARQISVVAEFVGSIDYDADITMAAIANPGNLNSFGPTESFGTSAPTSGNWRTGSRRWNTAPISGGVAFWVCHTGGSPGTWQPVRLADA